MRRAAALALALAASAASAQEQDQARTAWRYRRAVTLAGQEGFAAVDLPPDLRAHARADLRDVRLLAADGTEVPYVADRVVGRETSRSWPGTLTDTAQEPVGPADEAAGTTTWTVDLGAPHEIDTVALEVREQDFAKRLRVEGSADGREWTLLADDAPVFDRAWQGRVRHTRVALRTAATVRHLRLSTRDHRRAPPITLVGVTASWTRRSPGEAWSLPAPVTAQGSRDGVSRYRLEVPRGLPVEELTLAADDPAFSRRMVLRESRGGATRVLADDRVYRVRLPEEALAGQRLTLALPETSGDGELVLEVHDGDSPPLRGLAATVSGPTTRLLFESSARPVVLYYGNEVTRAPLYDLEPLRVRIAGSRPQAPAALGPEQENPAYQKPAPLPVGLLRGAAVDASRWRAERTVRVTRGEDLYLVTLAPADLARVRRDLGDLRLVDESSRQVPYILEPAAVEARLPLTAEPMRGAERVSRHRLTAALPEASAVPLGGIALQFSETFFDRALRVRIAGDRARDRVIWSGRLERRPGVGAPDPIRLSWTPQPASALEIEIEDGDNAPLTLVSAEGFAQVPRLTFQAGAGAYRLLLGHPEATAPQYDLASLRREVLAYSAVALPLEDARANPAFRRAAGDFLKDAPPTLLLWGTLLATVGALVWLTLRVLRQPMEPPSDGGSAPS